MINIFDKKLLNNLILALRRVNIHTSVMEEKNLKSLEGTGIYSIRLSTLFIHFDEIEFNEFEKFFILKLKSQIVVRYFI